MNKKQKVGIITSSICAIALAGGIIAGGTYALFTSESQTNIAVNSGKVAVVASISDFSAYTPKLIAVDGSSIINDSNIATKQSDNSYLFGNSGTVTLDNGLFSIDKMTPGDKVSFTVNVANSSNAKAKYRTVISFVEDDGLYNALYLSIGSEKLIFDENKKSYFAWKNLSLEDKTSEIPLTIEMPIDTGSEYQNKNCKIEIKVEAVQANANTVDEAGSLLYIANSADNEYIANELSDSLLSENITKIVYRNIVSEEDSTISQLIQQTFINSDSTLNLAGKTISVDSSNASSYNKATPVFMQVQNGATLTINDETNSGILTCEAGMSQVYGINVNNGKVVINGGNFYGALTAIQVKKGELEINGGFFDLAPTCKSVVPGSCAKYVINCIDASFKDGTAKISIKGGTFVNFNPSSEPEGNDTTYVAEGYKVVSSTHGSETWYTVVEDTSSTSSLVDE